MTELLVAEEGATSPICHKLCFSYKIQLGLSFLYYPSDSKYCAYKHVQRFIKGILIIFFLGFLGKLDFCLKLSRYGVKLSKVTPAVIRF